MTDRGGRLRRPRAKRVVRAEASDSRRATLGPGERLRRRSEFERVYRTGTRVSGRYMTLVALPNDSGVSRLGIAAPRLLGGAVRRNRAKRLIREIFRLNKPQHALDLVVKARLELLDTPFADLQADYQSILRRTQRGASSRTPPSRAAGPGSDSGV